MIKMKLQLKPRLRQKLRRKQRKRLRNRFDDDLVFLPLSRSLAISYLSPCSQFLYSPGLLY